MSSWHAKNVVTVDHLSDAVSPEFIQLLKSNTALQRLYFSPILLGDRQSGRASFPEYKDVKLEFHAIENGWRIQIPDSLAELELTISSGNRELEFLLIHPNDFTTTSPNGSFWVRSPSADSRDLGIAAPKDCALFSSEGTVQTVIQPQQMMSFALSKSVKWMELIFVKDSQVELLDVAGKVVPLPQL
jgi:hypothetical protein